MAEQTLGPVQGSSTLTDLLAAVLIDVARAQHLSNVYSAKLGEIYKADPMLRPFPVPNGYVGALDISLKFGIDELGPGTRRPESVLARAYAAFDDFVERLTPRVAVKLAKVLLDNADAFAGEEAEWLARTLEDERLVRSLIGEVQERVRPVVPDAVRENGEVRWDVAEPAIAAALRGAVVNHPDYARLPESARQYVYDEIAAMLKSQARIDTLRESIERPVPVEPEVRVATEREVLVSVGAEVLGSLQLATSVRDFLVEAAPAEVAPNDGGPPAPTKYRLVRAAH